MEYMLKLIWNDHDPLAPIQTNSILTFCCGFLLAIVLCGIRYVFETFICKPFALFMDIKEEKSIQILSNPTMEKFYASKKLLMEQDVSYLSKQTGLSAKEVQRWFQSRKLKNKSSKMKRFCESCWLSFSYLILFVYSTISLWDKTWFWDLRYCWHGYPNHMISNDIWVYHLLKLAFYLSLTLSQAHDVKRSDFWEMLLHHIITIILINFAFAANVFRIGSIIMWIHDISDILMKLAKICNYLGWTFYTDLLFYCFVISWILTRLCYFPTWIIFSCAVEAPQLMDVFPTFNLMKFVLCILLILHLLWTYTIFKMILVIYRSGTKGPTKDGRSDDSEDD